MNRRCHLRCLHCRYWQRGEGDRGRYLSADRRRELIEEFAELGPGGAVVVCGGESMLDLEDAFEIPIACRRTGVRCLAVTSGTRITDDALADRMIQEGPHEITISLDSHREAEHDRLRGVSGAFAKAVGAVRRLREARERAPGSDTLLLAMALVHEGNYRELPEFYDFALHELGVDKLKLNFLQPSFGGSGPDPFFAEYHVRDPAALREVILRCDARFGLGLREPWLDDVVMYHESVVENRDAIRGWRTRAGTKRHLCNPFDRNVIVDLYGVARHCFVTDFPGFPLRRRGDLRYFWYVFGEESRRRMKRCNRYCGISHSVRREPATSAPVPPRPWA